MIIRLPQFIENRLEALARRRDHTTAEVAREAILRYIEDSEDAYEAERILRRVRAGQERTYTLNDVADRFGLSGHGGLS